MQGGDHELVREMGDEFSVYNFHDILEATSNFSEENKLGEGGFGPVYKVHIQNPSIVLCKNN